VLKALYDEEINDDEFQELIASAPNDLAITQIRRLLIKQQKIVADQERMKALRDAVIEPYNERLAALAQEERMVRESVQHFVMQFGTVSFPDVGSAYLMPLKAKVEVVDNTKAKKWAKDNGYVKEEPDVTKAKNTLLKNGEVPPDDSGMQFVPEGFTLAIKPT
jgi:phosphoenolpyruvate synthase/pyruvate phosphate dikinase